MTAKKDNDNANSININLNEQAKKILERAQERGVEHSYMFVTAFKRYQEHISHLIILQDAITNEGPIITKEYVKGRGNICINPAVTAYNQTSGAADKTAQLLLRYIVAPLSDNNGMDEFEMF